MKNISLKTSLVLVTIVLTMSSCIHDEFEEPPVTTIPEGTILTIQDLNSIYFSDSVAQGTYKFTEDYSVYATVTMDDKSGNIYKSAYVQDGTMAINLHLLSSGGLYEGDSIRIYLKGLTLVTYSEMLQLDSVHVDDNVVKVSTLKYIEPEVVTIDQIKTGGYKGKLIKLENVQFVDGDLGSTYADEENLITEDRTIEDETGATMIVRTSGYASFAGTALPEGRGSLVAIAGIYNTTNQLYLRNTGEVIFDQRRFGDVDTLVYYGFDDIENGTPVSTADWANIAEVGALFWTGNNNGENGSVKITGDGNENTNWLILHELSIANGVMQFSTRAGLLTGASLGVYISTDYTGDGNPQNASWTELTANIATSPSGSYGDWTASGEVDLSSYSGDVYIAFKYNSDAGQSGVFYLDDFLIFS
ncbi:MAG: hypothetical protein C0596_10165 [Marinilabiliales bacterium]|nr:MAG: hypothetical protein C0596_10165 [Marinilabiliales bacterium]